MPLSGEIKKPYFHLLCQLDGVCGGRERGEEGEAPFIAAVKRRLELLESREQLLEEREGGRGGWKEGGREGRVEGGEEGEGGGRRGGWKEGGREN